MRQPTKTFGGVFPNIPKRRCRDVAQLERTHSDTGGAGVYIAVSANITNETGAFTASHHVDKIKCEIKALVKSYYRLNST